MSLVPEPGWTLTEEGWVETFSVSVSAKDGLTGEIKALVEALKVWSHPPTPIIYTEISNA